MVLGIAELFEIGFFEAFWNWSNPILTALVYAFVVVGVIIQITLQKKCCNSFAKWLFIGLCVIAIIISECLHQVITGWDRLAVDFLYGFSICLLLGAVIVKLIAFFKMKHKGV